MCKTYVPVGWRQVLRIALNYGTNNEDLSDVEVKNSYLAK
jgi:hypothetical protein